MFIWRRTRRKIRGKKKYKRMVILVIAYLIITWYLYVLCAFWIVLLLYLYLYTYPLNGMGREIYVCVCGELYVIKKMPRKKKL